MRATVSRFQCLRIMLGTPKGSIAVIILYLTIKNTLYPFVVSSLCLVGNSLFYNSLHVSFVFRYLFYQTKQIDHQVIIESYIVTVCALQWIELRPATTRVLCTNDIVQSLGKGSLIPFIGDMLVHFSKKTHFSSGGVIVENSILFAFVGFELFLLTICQ